MIFLDLLDEVIARPLRIQYQCAFKNITAGEITRNCPMSRADPILCRKSIGQSVFSLNIAENLNNLCGCSMVERWPVAVA